MAKRRQLSARRGFLIAGGAVLLLYALTKLPKTAMAYRGGAPIGRIILKPVGNGVFLERSRADAFLAMKADAAKAGVTLVANSGYRGIAQQTTLYAAYVARLFAPPMVARPGFSNHSAGDTTDISIPPSGTAPDHPQRLASKEYGWLKLNAHRYGFRNDLVATKEAWHWSPTGR